MSLTVRMLVGLVAGLAAGAALSWFATPWRGDAVALADAVGGVWLDGLRMTIVPLVFALLVTGIGRTAGVAQAGGAAGRAVATFVVLLAVSALLAALVTPLLLQAWPAPAQAAAALRASASDASAVPPTPPIAQWLRSIVPANAVKAAAETAMAPLVFFALVFGLAATRIEPERRASLFGFFDAVQATMLVIVRWVLWVAPLGVFALGLVVGARAGLGALGVLGHYVVVISILCLLAGVVGLLVGLIGGRLPLGRTASAMVPVWAVAIATQSSLASLPAMLEATRRLDVAERIRDLVLPMAVALFRITSPAGNLAVAIYVAHIYGIALDPMRIAAGALVAVLVSVSAVGVASAVTFFASLAPISVAMGLPMELLPLFLAVEALPDISRTVGNVTADVGVTGLANRWNREPAIETIKPAEALE